MGIKTRVKNFISSLGTSNYSEIYTSKKTSVTIDGKSYFSTNGSIRIVNDKVYIDGKEVDNESTQKEINITIEGNTKDIDIGVCNSINIKGNVQGDLEVGTGDVECFDVGGDVDVMNGDIHCNNVSGDIDIMNGDVLNK